MNRAVVFNLGRPATPRREAEGDNVRRRRSVLVRTGFVNCALAPVDPPGRRRPKQTRQCTEINVPRHSGLGRNIRGGNVGAVFTCALSRKFVCEERTRAESYGEHRRHFPHSSVSSENKDCFPNQYSANSVGHRRPATGYTVNIDTFSPTPRMYIPSKDKNLPSPTQSTLKIPLRVQCLAALSHLFLRP